MTRLRAQPLAFALALALAMVAGAAAVWSFVWPSADPWVQVGRVEDFPPGSVTPLGTNAEPLAFHIVRLDDGELLALLTRVPHPNPECMVSYLPDFVLDDRAGWFRHTCYPFTYDLAGRWAWPRTDVPRPLDRLAVEVRDGAVYVDPHTITSGAHLAPDGRDFQTGGTLLPPRRY